MFFGFFTDWMAGMLDRRLMATLFRQVGDPVIRFYLLRGCGRAPGRSSSARLSPLSSVPKEEGPLEKLEKLLYSKNLHVVERAILELVRLDTDEAFNLLETYIVNGKYSREAAYELALEGSRRSIDVLKQLAWDSDRVEVRCNAAWALGHSKPLETTMAFLEVLSDKDSARDVRIQANEAYWNLDALV